MSVAATPELDPYRIRADFPILSQDIYPSKPLIYLDNAATTQRPRVVIDSLVTTYERYYANVHRGIHWLSDQSTDLFEEARERVRQFIHARQRHEVIFTTGTTSAINLVARSWGDSQVQAGDELLLSEMEHHSNLVPWQQLCQRVGCRIRTLPVTDDGELDVEQLPQLLNSRTRLVAITAVSNVLGTINPIPDLVAAAHQVGATVLVDAAQAVPHQQVDVQAWGADFVAFSGHKMMGPSGVGVLYGREALLDAMPPFLGGGSMIRRVWMEGFESADLPAKFEAGTPPIVPAIGLKAAIDYLEAVGLDAITRHEQRLTEYAHRQLKQIEGVTLLGPPPARKAGIVSFVVQSIHSHDVAQILDREGIAIRAGHHCAMPLHQRLGLRSSSRASFYLYNTQEEIDHLATGIRIAQQLFQRRQSNRSGRSRGQ